MSFTPKEKSIMINYLDETLEIFDTVLSDEFNDPKKAFLILNGINFFRNDFVNLKSKIQSN